MSVCNPTNKTKENWEIEQDKIWKHWQSKENIVERFTDRYRGYDKHKSMENMKWLIEQRIDLPYDSDLPLSDALVRRIKVEINAWDRSLGTKFHNLFFMVPEGISRQDPVSRKFFLRLGDILNYERVQLNRILSRNGLIADHMFDAFARENKYGTVKTYMGKTKIGRNFIGNEALEELRRLRKEMMHADPEMHVQNEFIGRMQELIDSDGGKTLRQYVELVHMNNKEFESARLDSKEEPFNPFVVKAVQSSRSVLNISGTNYVNGLNGLKKIIALKFGNTTNISEVAKNHPQARRWIKEIDDAIDTIKKGMKKGGYFPHTDLETMMSVKEGISKALSSKKLSVDKDFSDLVDNIIAGISPGMIPGHAQGKHPALDKYWEKDPMLVIAEYGEQANQFNKTIYTQIAYLEALKHIPKTDMNFVKGLRRFLDEEYAVFTMGSNTKPEWVNSSVRTLQAIQTARTMGLNITGALKNATSAIHYYSRVGFNSIRDTQRARNNDPHFRAFLDASEKEAGFLFTDYAKELYQEGSISAKQRDGIEVVFNPENGRMRIREKDGKWQDLKTFLASGVDWTLDKALFLHRLTENSQRKWMYRTSMYKKYNQLQNEGYDIDKTKQFSKRYALQMVNAWAYEYAAYAKSKAVRGEWRTIEEMQDGNIVRKSAAGAAGSLSELAFQLLHYPSSLFSTHWRETKGGIKALMARQGLESEELQYLLRYGGAMTLMSAVGVLMNVDFENLFENETKSRLQRALSDVMDYDSTEKPTFGLISEVFGPWVGTLKYLAIALGIIDMESSDLNKILFGNVNYADPNDQMAAQYEAYQLSTFWGTTKNKIWPAIKSGRGRDVYMHYMKQYPSATTKKYNKMLFQRDEGVHYPTGMDETQRNALAIVNNMMA